MRRGVHPEVAAIVGALSRDAVLALRRDGRRDLAVVIDAGREGFDLPDAVDHEAGHRWTIMPRVEALALGREHTLQAGELLAEALPHGETWVLVLGPQGSAAVPLVEAHPRGGRA